MREASSWNSPPCEAHKGEMKRGVAPIPLGKGINVEIELQLESLTFRDQDFSNTCRPWTQRRLCSVIPAKAGIQYQFRTLGSTSKVPRFPLSRERQARDGTSAQSAALLLINRSS